jgi:hypothetical protein
MKQHEALLSKCKQLSTLTGQMGSLSKALQEKDLLTAYDLYSQLISSFPQFSDFSFFTSLESKIDSKKCILLQHLYDHFNVQISDGFLGLAHPLTRITSKPLWTALEELNATNVVSSQIHNGLLNLLTQMFMEGKRLSISQDDSYFQISLTGTATLEENLNQCIGLFDSLMEKLFGFDSIAELLLYHLFPVISDLVVKFNVQLTVLRDFDEKMCKICKIEKSLFFDFYKEFDSIQITREKQVFLEKVRTIMLNYKMDELIVVNATEIKDSIFYFPTTQISKEMLNLVDLIAKYIERVDVTTLNACIHLVTSFSKKTEDPALSMILVNDFMYISHQLLVLSYKYNKPIHPLFVKCREKANGYLLTQIQLISLEMMEHFVNLGGFHTIITKQKGQIYLKQLTETHAKMLKLWKVLNRDLLLASIGKVYESIFDYIVKNVLEMRDIDAEESESMAIFLNSVLKMVAIFKDQVETYIVNFGKFTSVILLLDIKLVEIVDCVKTKKIRGLNKQQLAGIIQALFEDTENRRKVLNDLNILVD